MQPTDPILNPTIFLASFEWREPVTTLTDLLVAIVCVIGFIKFASFKGEKSGSFIFFKYYFLSFGIGMICAAWLGHGLQAYIGAEFKNIGWACSITGSLFLSLGSLQHLAVCIKRGHVQILKVLFSLHYILFMVLVLVPAFSAFIYAQLGSSIALIGFVLPMHLYSYIKTKARGSLIIICAILYALLPGFVFNSQISLHRWFNYNDISHVLISFFMVIMIFGTSKLSMSSSRN